MNQAATLTVDGREIAIDGERNLLELIRKANIELPTFCYHSELSVYGACRLCIVDIEGRGICSACSTPPEPGLRIRTNTEEVRDIRRISIELLLANHEGQCTTCAKGPDCQLQKLAHKLGVRRVRFKSVSKPCPIDESSLCLVRDPGKCVLCGDCVRICSEVQGIGAIDFVKRGASVTVSPAFGKDLAQVECVGCGQCARVCPTGAIMPRSETEEVWRALTDPRKYVVAQIAPAVRVAIGELFGFPAGSVTIGQTVAALKQMGFKKVFDTSFAADLTAVEETEEFVARKAAGRPGPLFTSCCPAWVQFAEQYHPDLLDHLSTCKSPQQMLGAMTRKQLPEAVGIDPDQLVIVSIMPCTAKKAEARRECLATEAGRDIDHVLTTLELGRMVEESGLRFARLEPQPLDMPFAFKTGAGVIFGASGGVAEAVVRCAADRIGTCRPESVDTRALRGDEPVRRATIILGDQTLRIGVVHGLAKAAEIADAVKRGECDLDLVEVMACPGGCVSGAGNPAAMDVEQRRARVGGLRDSDRMLELHAPQENPYVQACYARLLERPGSPTAHRLLHTHHASRRRIDGEVSLVESSAKEAVKVRVCVGTSCLLRGAQTLIQRIMAHVEAEGLADQVDLAASFCQEACDRGPTVVIDGTRIEHCDFAAARARLEQALKSRGSPGNHESAA